MISCIVCEVPDCKIIHTAEEIRAVSVFPCYVCQKYNCTDKHTLEDLKNPAPPSKENVVRALQICIAYDKLVNYLNNGDDQVSTE